MWFFTENFMKLKWKFKDIPSWLPTILYNNFIHLVLYKTNIGVLSLFKMIADFDITVILFIIEIYLIKLTWEF